MSNEKVNDKKMLRMIDTGLSQSEVARKLGVSRQAVNQRFLELRGRTTKAVVVKKIAEVVEDRIDTLGQLKKINTHANDMLDLLIRWQNGDPEALRVLESQAKTVTYGEDGKEVLAVEIKMKDPRELALRCMGEIREQLEFQHRIFESLYSLKQAEEYQQEVLAAIGDVDPNVRQRIISKLNQRRALRTAIRWN